MNSDLALLQPLELAALARKHHTSVARVREVIRENDKASLEQVEAELDKRPEPWWLPPGRGSKGR